MKKIKVSDAKLERVSKDFDALIQRINDFQFEGKRSHHKDDLEMCVIPQSTFMQNLRRFRPTIDQVQLVLMLINLGLMLVILGKI